MRAHQGGARQRAEGASTKSGEEPLLKFDTYPRRGKRALGRIEECGRMGLIDSEMAGPVGLKLGGLVPE